MHPIDTVLNFFHTVFGQGKDLDTPQMTGADLGYRVSLESDNQEAFLDIILTPSHSDIEDWNYTCGDAEDATRHYDKALLEEVGEQIEAYLTKRLV